MTGLDAICTRCGMTTPILKAMGFPATGVVLCPECCNSDISDFSGQTITIHRLYLSTAAGEPDLDQPSGSIVLEFGDDNWNAALDAENARRLADQIYVTLRDLRLVSA